MGEKKMSFDESFFVALAFVIVIGAFVYLRLPQRLLAALDSRAAEIKAELDEARRLRKEAAQVLADYESRREQAEQQAAEIIADAKQAAQRTADEARTAMRAQLARRSAQAEQNIARAEAELVKQVRVAVVELAVAAATRLLAEGFLGEADLRKIIEDNIVDIGTHLTNDGA